MADGVVLTEAAFREIRRMYYDTKRMHANLKARLSTRGVRRHQPGTSLPSRVLFRNDSSSVVPAHGVMRVTGGDADDMLTVDSVDATYRWIYLVNGPRPVAVGGEGVGTFLMGQGNTPKYTRVSVSGATPAYGERWGPVSGSTALGQHRPGFFILGGHNSTTNTVRAIQIPPGEVRVKNDDGSGTLAAGGTGRTFGIYGGTAGTTDSGLEVTLNNGSSVDWAANKYGWATADAGGAIWGAPHQT